MFLNIFANTQWVYIFLFSIRTNQPKHKAALLVSRYLRRQEKIGNLFPPEINDFMLLGRMRLFGAVSHHPFCYFRSYGTRGGSVFRYSHSKDRPLSSLPALEISALRRISPSSSTEKFIQLIISGTQEFKGKVKWKMNTVLFPSCLFLFIPC